LSELLEVVARQLNETVRRVGALEDGFAALLDGLLDRDEQVQFRLSAMAGDIEGLREFVSDGIARILASGPVGPDGDEGNTLPIPQTSEVDNADEGERGAEEFAERATA
jgi:hypothetical protein